MKKIIQQKEVQVKRFADLMNTSVSFLIFEYQGLDSTDMTSVRKEMLKNNASIFVVKNNILNRSLQQAGYDGFKTLVGPNAIAFGTTDEIAPLRIIDGLMKDNQFIVIKGSVIEKQFIDAEKTIVLSKLPNKEGLYSMLLSCLTSPIRSFLYGLKAICDQKN
ncbi:MAG: 50S ribosomal protein L10 [Mycoplasmoidaceae bacterium]